MLTAACALSRLELLTRNCKQRRDDAKPPACHSLPIVADRGPTWHARVNSRSQLTHHISSAETVRSHPEKRYRTEIPQLWTKFKILGSYTPVTDQGHIWHNAADLRYTRRRQISSGSVPKYPITPILTNFAMLEGPITLSQSEQEFGLRKYVSILWLY